MHSHYLQASLRTSKSSRMASQAATAVIVDAVVMKILHAHSFARTSAQAVSVLSNLLTRYLVLLASACGQFSELAGRSNLSVHDLVACLEELGTNVDELAECCTEGVELSRYASSSAKRLDDLADFRGMIRLVRLTLINAFCSVGYLEEGFIPADDPIPLHYAPLAKDVALIDGVVEDCEESDDGLSDPPEFVPVAVVDRFTEPLSYREHPTASFLPDFLPPFPDASQPQSPSPTPAPHAVKMERPPSPLPQHITSISAGDYLMQVPYSESVLASTPSWHLPSQPSAIRTSKPPPPRFPTPSTQQALLAAYHHILTHPVSQPGPPNPAKHKVAMALLSQIQNNARWDAPSTLYANVAPCPPRVASIGPSYPIAHSTLEDSRPAKDVDKELDKRPMLPPAPPRPVFTNDKPVYLASQQASRLPELARQVLPVCTLCFLACAMLRLPCIGSRTVAYDPPHASSSSATRVAETVLWSGCPSAMEFLAEHVCRARRQRWRRRRRYQRARRVIVYAPGCADVCDVGL